MKVTGVRTTVVGAPWRELAFLEVETDAGLVGVSETRMVNKTETLLACINELSGRYLVGTDPFDVERLAWNVQWAEYGRAGEVSQSTLAAFEVACWDLMGQALGVRLNHDACAEHPASGAWLRLFQPGWERREGTPDPGLDDRAAPGSPY